MKNNTCVLSRIDAIISIINSSNRFSATNGVFPASSGSAKIRLTPTRFHDITIMVSPSTNSVVITERGIDRPSKGVVGMKDIPSFRLTEILSFITTKIDQLESRSALQFRNLCEKLHSNKVEFNSIRTDEIIVLTENGRYDYLGRHGYMGTHSDGKISWASNNFKVTAESSESSNVVEDLNNLVRAVYEEELKATEAARMSAKRTKEAEYDYADVAGRWVAGALVFALGIIALSK